MKGMRRNRRRIGRQLLSLLLCLVLIAEVLPLQAAAKEHTIHWTCQICHTTYDYETDMPYDDALDLVDAKFSDCCNCCSVCWDDWHCYICGACFYETGVDPISTKNMCLDCAENYKWCQQCGEMFGVESDECMECEEEVCLKCHEERDAFCTECGYCLYSAVEANEACTDFYSLSEREYCHCEVHCKVCVDCGMCFLHDPSNYCEACGMCIDCAVTNLCHCATCRECFVVKPACEEGDVYYCLQCCEGWGYHCPKCGEHTENDDWCPTGGYQSHCMTNCEKETCAQCGVCFYCEHLRPCPDCELCPSCCKNNTEFTGCECGLCIESADYTDHICSECNKAVCTTESGELCSFCGYCDECCAANTEDSGCECGLCVEDPGYLADDHLCSQCQSAFACAQDFCPDCGLCEDCCRDNAESEGCDCGESVCVESAGWEDHYCAECGHCLPLCDCDDSCTCEKCNAGAAYRHAHVYDAEGYCTLCGISRYGDPIITSQPRGEIRCRVADPKGNYYANRFSLRILARGDVEYQWYVTQTPEGAGTALTDRFDDAANRDITHGATEAELTTWVPLDACKKTYYYYCVVHDPHTGKSVRSASARLVAEHLYHQKWVSDTKHNEACVGCGQLKPGGKSGSHQFGDWRIGTFPTETSEGSRYYPCIVCGGQKTEVLPKLDKNHVHDYACVPSSSSPALGHFRECFCGVRISDLQEHTMHNLEYKPATTTQKGLRRDACWYCGYEVTTVLPIAPYHKHRSNEENSSSAYLKEYRDESFHNHSTHWLECDEPGCDERIWIQPHEFEYELMWGATNPYEDVPQKNGRVLGQCKACQEYHIKDFTWGQIPVVVTDGKSGRAMARKGDTVTIRAKPPKGYMFDHWEVLKGEEYVTLEDENERVTSFKMPRLRDDYKGKSFIWIKAVCYEAPVSVQLVGAGKKGRDAWLEDNQTLCADGSVHNDGDWNLSAEPDRIAYFEGNNLFLSNYHAGPITIVHDDLKQPLHIFLQGKSNSITYRDGYDYGIKGCDVGGDLTITAEKNCILHINLASSDTIYGIRMSDRKSESGDVTIKGMAEVDINVDIDSTRFCADGNKHSAVGIASNRNVNVLEDAALIVNTNAPPMSSCSNGTVYEAVGVLAKDNVNIDTESMIWINACRDRGSSGAGIRAKNITIDRTDEMNVVTCASVRPLRGAVGLPEELALSEGSYQSYRDKSRTLNQADVLHSIRVRLPAPSADYTFNLLDDYRTAANGDLLLAPDDELKCSVQLAEGRVWTSDRRIEAGGRLYEASREKNESSIFSLDIMEDTDIEIRNIRRVDPFQLPEQEITVLRGRPIHLTWKMQPLEASLVANSKYPHLILQRYTGGKWTTVQGVAPAPKVNGWVDYTEPSPEPRWEEYRFLASIGDRIYPSEAIVVEWTDDPEDAQTGASAIELYLPPTSAARTFAGTCGYPKIYDDGRTWIRMDSEHQKLYCDPGSGGAADYVSTNRNLSEYGYELAGEFDPASGKLTLYAKQLDYKVGGNPVLGAIRTAPDAAGDLSVRIKGNLVMKTDCVAYGKYTDGNGSHQDRLRAGICNPVGSLSVFSAAQSDQSWLRLTVSAEGGTFYDEKGRNVGGSAYCIEARDDVRIDGPLTAFLYPDCDTGRWVGDRGTGAGIVAGRDILLKGDACVSISNVAVPDFCFGLSAGRDVHINDDAVLETDLANVTSYSDAGARCCAVEAGGSFLYDSADDSVLQITSDFEGAARAVSAADMIVIGGAGSLEVGAINEEGWSWCFGGGADIFLESHDMTVYTWWYDREVDGKLLGGPYEREPEYDDGWLVMNRSTLNSESLAVPGDARTLSFEKTDCLRHAPPVTLGCLGYQIRTYSETVTVPTAPGYETTVKLDMPQMQNGKRFLYWDVVSEQEVEITYDDYNETTFTMPPCDVTLIPVFEDVYFYDWTPAFYPNAVGPVKDGKPMSGTLVWNAFMRTDRPFDLYLQHYAYDEETGTWSWKDYPYEWKLTGAPYESEVLPDGVIKYSGSTVLYRDAALGTPYIEDSDPTGSGDPNVYGRYRLMLLDHGTFIYGDSFVIDWDHAARLAADSDGHVGAAQIPAGPVGSVYTLDLSKLTRNADSSFFFAMSAERDGAELCPGVSFTLDANTGLLTAERVAAQSAVPWHSGEGDGCSFWLEDAWGRRVSDLGLFSVGEVFESERYGLYVGDTEVMAYNADDVLGDGSVSYDASTNTLTLINADVRGASLLEKPAANGSALYASQSGKTLTVEIPAGTASTLRGSFAGLDAVAAAVMMEAKTDLVIRGGGTLTVKGASFGGNYGAGYGISGDTVTVCGDVTVNAAAGSRPDADHGSSYGMLARSRLTVRDRAVLALSGGTAKNSFGLLAMDLQMEGGVIAADGGRALRTAPANTDALSILAGDQRSALKAWNGTDPLTGFRALLLRHSSVNKDYDHGHTPHDCLGGTPTCSEKALCVLCGEPHGKTIDHVFRDGKCVWCGKEEPGWRAIGEKPEPLGDLTPFRFEDVKDPAKFYFEPVYWAYEHTPQITNGVDATHFGPDRTCTRAQVVTFLWRATGQPEPTKKDNPFTDVKEGQYYYKAVLWALEKGITTGTSATNFSPDSGCTRGQVVTFLHRAKGTPTPGSSVNPFTDVATGQYYYDAVLWAVNHSPQITNGTSATTFSPGSTCTRGQIVTFLYRSMK